MAGWRRIVMIRNVKGQEEGVYDVRRWRMHLERLFRTAYAISAFTGAVVIGSYGTVIPVHASDTPPYAVETQVAVNAKLVDQLAVTQVEIQHRMDGLDTRQNDISDRVS